MAVGDAQKFELFVNGTLMRDLPLHANLAGATFIGEAMTAPRYRLYSIDDRHPGMFEVAQGGVAVRGELYRISAAIWKVVASREPAGLYRGRVQLADGREVEGILFPRELAEVHHRDISEFGGWRAYIAHRSAAKTSETLPRHNRHPSVTPGGWTSRDPDVCSGHSGRSGQADAEG